MLGSGTTGVSSALWEPVGIWQACVWLPGSCCYKNYLVPCSTLGHPWVPWVMSVTPWLTRGLDFRTLCNYMLCFLFHPSLKAGEISLAINARNSLPASGVSGLGWDCNRCWMNESFCPPSWWLLGAEIKWVEDADQAVFICLVCKDSQTHPGWTLCYLDLWHSSHDPRTSSISIIWELVKMQTLRPLPE